MRLDHLLSREPIIVGNDHGVRPVGGGLGLFSCARMCSLPDVGGGCGCVFGLGIKSYTSGHTVGFTFNTV